MTFWLSLKHVAIGVVLFSSNAGDDYIYVWLWYIVLKFVETFQLFLVREYRFLMSKDSRFQDWIVGDVGTSFSFMLCKMFILFLIEVKIFIHHTEQTPIQDPNNNKYAQKIIYWYRYVDNILFFNNGNKKQNN